MSLEALIDKINDIMEEHVSEMEEVRVKDIGLDPRAGFALFIDHESIVVRKDNDNALQYYGGFSYIYKEFRVEFGDFVVYSSEDRRVADCIECWSPQLTS